MARNVRVLLAVLILFMALAGHVQARQDASHLQNEVAAADGLKRSGGPEADAAPNGRALELTDDGAEPAALAQAATGTIAGAVTRASDGAAVTGATVKALQAGVVRASATSGAGGAYTLADLAAGTYDLQVTAPGYEAQARAGVAVSEQATAAADFSLNAVGITYIYDANGRLAAVVEPGGETARYTYDAVGNLQSITRQPAATVHVIDFNPKKGLAGTVVTIYGTGFSTTPGQNSVNFNGVAAVVTSASATQIVTTVPAGATTGPINVTTPAGSASSATPFTVAAAGPAIDGFTPSVGTAGTPVSINGSGFEGTPSGNRVFFNLKRTAAVAATATSLTASVPEGATSGHISVTTSEGRGTSAGYFYVPPPPFTAADVEVTGQMAVGESEPVTIATAGKIGLVVFEGAAGSRVSLRITGSTITSCSVYIYNPDGTSLGSVTANTGGGFIDVRTLPVNGTYTILVDPQSTYTGGLTLALYDAADATGTITPGGPPVTAATTVPGQNARLTFNGTAGQRISLRVDNTTYGGGASRVYINNPDGTALGSDTSVNTGDFIDTKTLPTAGVYTVLIDPNTTSTGSMTVTLHDVPSDGNTPITPGGAAVTVTTTVPGQNALLSFDGAAGRRISLRVDNSTYGGGNSQVVIYNPDGTVLASDTSVSTGDFIDARTLPAAGIYAILVNPDLHYVGSMTITLNDLPADVTGTITPGGPPVTVTTTMAGQNARLTFDGTAGQRISLRIDNSTYGGGNSQVVIYNPDGTLLASDTSVNTGDFIDVKTLAAAGTYTILVNPDLHYVGSTMLSLYDVVDAAGTITPGGPAVTVTAAVPGQSARLTFSGTTGQRVSLRLTGVTIASSAVSIIKPDGVNLAAPTTVNTGGGFIDTKLLPADGAYTILVDPASSNTGSMTLTLYDVPADVSGTISVGGSAVAVTTSVPGQNALLTFEGTAGQRVSLRMTGVTIPGSTSIVIRKPDGTNLVASSTTTSGSFVDAQTLPAAGTYGVFVDPSTYNTGGVTLTLNDANEVTGTITPGGPPVTVTTNASGQNARLTFTGTTGQRVSLRLSSVTIASSGVSIIKPDGVNLVAPTTVTTSGAFIDMKVLPADGTYTILIDPSSTNMGSMTATLYDVPSDGNTPITPGGPPVTVTTTVPGQNALLSFDGAAGQLVSLRMTGVTIAGTTTVTIRKPDGTSLASGTTTTSGNYIDTKTLPVAGTYTVFVDPSSSNTGAITLTLNAVVDVSGTITPGGAPVTATITTAGQSARLTFSGTTGQRVSLRLTGVTIASSAVSIIKPDGVNLAAPTTVNTGGGFIDTKLLPADGAYTILVDPASSNTGSMTLTLYDVPADVSGTISVGGSAVAVTTSVPGQNALLTFEGTAGQQVTVRVTGNTMSTTAVRLLRPDGTTLTSSTSSSSGFNLTTQTLAATGTYTISIDPSGANTGSMNVSVTTP